MRARIRNTEIYFDIDGVGLAAGSDRMVQRPALFLLHGGPGGDHSSFKTQLAPLRDTAQLVYIDHRGSGRSSAADPASYTLDENILDLEALRDYLGLEHISVLGFSYGGMVAQGYAIRFPDRVEKLILSATAPSYRFIKEAQQIVERLGTPEQQRVCQRLWNATFESEKQVREYYRTMGPMYSRKFNESKFEQGWTRGIRNFQQLNSGFGGFLKTFDFIDRLPEIHCPTLVLAGAHDWICPPSQSKLIARKIRNAELKVFANSSHQIAHDEPERFLQVVRKFLTG
ncbi:MAG: prolyl aminopeptidase [Planctomycetaceae bacterium]|nr:prolyl aminopeptidase [Planctomycetaceae bacterium]MBP60854.1 prolyl aminopeptidase [Planctomycetaceae bacterium]